MPFTRCFIPTGSIIAKKGKAKVLRDETIELSYHPEDDNGKKLTNQQKTLRLRRLCYQDEKNRYFEFLTNNFDIEAEEVAFLHKRRWGIELLFKKNETELSA